MYYESLSPLTPGDEELLKKLVCRFGGQPFSELAWEGISSISRSGVEMKLSFIRLRKYRWVHAVKKSWGERLYYIPVEKLIQLLTFFFSPGDQHASDPSGLHIRCEAGPGIALDLLHLLAFAADQGLTLTAKGTVHKKNLQKLQKLISLKEEHLWRLALQYAHQDTYPPELAVILDLLLCTGLLSPNTGALGLEEKRLRQWLCLNELEMNRLLLRAAIERYGQSDAAMQLFRYIICMPPFGEGKWIKVSSVLQWMEDERMLIAGDCSDKAAAWLYVLAGFGWGDVAATVDGEFAFRWNIEPELLPGSAILYEYGDENFFVQPDFDIICPPNVPFLARWKLLACADLVLCDRVSVYKLTRSSVGRAVEKGMSPPEILSFLAANGAGGIPDHVAAAVGQWGNDPLKTVGGNGLTDYTYPLIYRDKMDEAHGNMWSESFYDEHQGMVYSGRNVHFFEPDDDIPEPASLFPGYEQVPTRWLHDLRTYHSSTARTIVEQAQSWQTKIVLNLGGKRAEFTPTKVYPSPWRAEGILHHLETGRFEPHELRVEELGELKLILPPFD